MNIISKKRRNIYIGTIVFCVIAALGVLTLSKPSLPEIQLPATTTKPATSNPTGGNSAKSGAASISVFPQNIDFDVSIFDHDRFKTLKVYEPVNVDPAKELGRDNPYLPYQ